MSKWLCLTLILVLDDYKLYVEINSNCLNIYGNCNLSTLSHAPIIFHYPCTISHSNVL